MKGLRMATTIWPAVEPTQKALVMFHDGLECMHIHVCVDMQLFSKLRMTSSEAANNFLMSTLVTTRTHNTR